MNANDGGNKRSKHIWPRCQLLGVNVNRKQMCYNHLQDSNEALFETTILH